MDERTLMVDEGERTQMVGSVACPVCGEDNPAGAAWCAACGFRLDSTPGEATEPEARYALVGEGHRFLLKTGENVVGRLNADVYLSDASVSRRHAVITVGTEGVMVRDEASSNGTRMNDMRLPPDAESPLLPGETVQFGAVAFTLEAPGGVEAAVPPARDVVAGDAWTEAAPAPDNASPPAVLTNGVDTWPLRPGTNSIGRRSDNDVTLSDPAVSGRHATVTLEGGVARIADAGSTNGTFLNDQRLIPGSEATLPQGAIVRFGPVVLNYEVLPETAPEADEPGQAEDAPVPGPDPGPVPGPDPGSDPGSDTAAGEGEADAG